MNRRELFQGLGAVLAAASIPITVEAFVALSNDEIIVYLKRVRLDLINKIMHPPVIMHEDGRMEPMNTSVWADGLRQVNAYLKEFDA